MCAGVCPLVPSHVGARDAPRQLVYLASLGHCDGQYSVAKGRPEVLLGELQAFRAGYFGPGKVRVTEDHLTISLPRRTFLA